MRGRRSSSPAVSRAARKPASAAAAGRWQGERSGAGDETCQVSRSLRGPVAAQSPDSHSRRVASLAPSFSIRLFRLPNGEGFFFLPPSPLKKTLLHTRCLLIKCFFSFFFLPQTRRIFLHGAKQTNGVGRSASPSAPGANGIRRRLCPK